MRRTRTDDVRHEYANVQSRARDASEYIRNETGFHTGLLHPLTTIDRPAMRHGLTIRVSQSDAPTILSTRRWTYVAGACSVGDCDRLVRHVSRRVCRAGRRRKLRHR